MAENDNQKTLRLILKALKLFPKIVKEKARVHREKERILKRFEPLSRQLKKLTDQARIQEAQNSRKFTIVHEHPRHVPISGKNPDGITIVDRHPRRLPGTYLDSLEIERIFKSYDRRKIVYPAKADLGFKGAESKYDDEIAVWTDYFNKKFHADPPLSPNVVKALIASESEFKADPGKNKVAIGITQITKKTLVIMQDPNGEAREFIFNKIREKDLKNPRIAIPMMVRWLFRKRELAAHKLKRSPTSEELVLEYKGLLKSKSAYKQKALNNFSRNYEKLQKNEVSTIHP